MNTQNLRQTNGTLLTVDQKVSIHTNIQSNFLTNLLESSLCDYPDAYVLVTGNINVAGTDDNTKLALRNCSPFRKCRTKINETFIDEAEHINIAMPMYNLIEHSDNYSDTSGIYGSLKEMKWKEILIRLLMVIIFQIIRHHLIIKQVLLQAEMM